MQRRRPRSRKPPLRQGDGGDSAETRYPAIRARHQGSHGHPNGASGIHTGGADDESLAAAAIFVRAGLGR